MKIEKLAKHESENCPGALFLSSFCLIIVSNSGNFCASSIFMGVSLGNKFSGSRFEHDYYDRVKY